MTDNSLPPPADKINPLLTAALDYAARGIHVLPLHAPLFDADGKCRGCTCELYARSAKNRKRLETKGLGNTYDPRYVCPQPGKHAHGDLVPNGVIGATTDPEIIRSWWKKYPRANVGMNCGASGVIALDADTYKDSYTGDLSALDQETVTQLSGGGGTHLIYAMPDGATYGNSKGNLEAGIDIRGNNGILVLAPSVHWTGNYYQWETGYAPGEIPFAPMPEALRKRLDFAARTGGKEAGPPDSEAVARSVDLVQRVLLTGNIAHGNPEVYGGEGRRIKLATCPFNPPDDPHGADRSAVVIIHADGEIRATCNHSRCKDRISTEAGGKGWAMLREIAGAGTVAHANGNGETLEDVDYFPAEPPPESAEAPVTTPTPAGTPQRRKQFDADGVRLTDLGNARRLVQLHGSDMRYCYAWNAWLVWDGTRWNRDESGQAQRWAKHTVTRIYTAAGDAEDSDRKGLAKWAMQSEARDRLSAMVDLARSEAGIAVRPDDLDTDAMLLNVANGTLNLRTQLLQPHRREDLITKLAPVAYDAAATCPLWDAFLWRIMGGRQDMIDFLQRAVGYALTGDVSEQVLFYLYGHGANGKSTFLTTVLAMLGKDFATQAAPELLTQGDRHPTEIADLRGMRFVASTEVEDGRRMAETLVKQMTGGDVMKARFMRGDFFQFDPTHKLFLAANHKLVISGPGKAIWRRIRLIPFDVTISDDEKDPRLPEKLRAELPGILAWAVRGCAAWVAQGLNTPADVTTATSEYKSEMDVLGRYLEERTVTGTSFVVQAKPLYLDYQDWCKENGERELSQVRFARDLADRGYTKETSKSTRLTTYQGIGLAYTESDKSRGDGTAPAEPATTLAASGREELQAKTGLSDVENNLSRVKAELGL
ncbi:MAG: phage/plasmid primase, P4 family [Azonexus sp.]